MLSGGERQMVAVSRRSASRRARCCSTSPRQGWRRGWSTSCWQRCGAGRRGLPLLLVEQNVRATLELVDELDLLERGQVVAEGPVASMKDDPRILEAYLGSLTA